MTLNFEPALPDRFPSLRSYIAHRASIQRKPAKVIAADMDMSPSALSRKLNPGEGDTQRFNVDDLPRGAFLLKIRDDLFRQAVSYLWH